MPKALTVFTFTLALLSLAETSEARRFGVDGHDGRHGRDGRDGASHHGAIYTATNSVYEMNVSGQDGLDGRDGTDGENAWSCYQPSHEPNNLNGANGGDAGDGGDGGNGGNAGPVTLYYDDLSLLSNIKVIAIPGEGGRAGRAGYPGDGCRCSRRSWTVRDRNGNTQTYFCNHGTDGWRAQNGFSGRQGRDSVFMLVPQTSPLPRANYSLNKTFSEWNESPTELSRHIWENQNGLDSLLHPHSIIPNKYFKYSHTVQSSFTLIWDASRPISDFEESNHDVSLNKDGVLTFTPNDALAINYASFGLSSDLTIKITGAVYKAEMRNVSYLEDNGIGQDLTISYKDGGKLGNMVSTQIELDYKTSGFPTYKTRWEGTLDPELYEISEEGITIKIGNLPIKKKYKRKNLWAKAKIKIHRTFANHTETISLKNKFLIGDTEEDDDSNYP